MQELAELRFGYLKHEKSVTMSTIKRYCRSCAACPIYVRWAFLRKAKIDRLYVAAPTVPCQGRHPARTSRDISMFVIRLVCSAELWSFRVKEDTLLAVNVFFFFASQILLCRVMGGRSGLTKYIQYFTQLLLLINKRRFAKIPSSQGGIKGVCIRQP